MPSAIEFRLACRGLLQLARFDAGFLRYFDRSTAGALRSFWLALPILPFDLVHAWLSVPHPLPNPGLFLAAETIGYAVGWILFPLLLLSIGRGFEREREVPGCIAVYNWTSLLGVALQTPALLLTAIDPNSGLGDGLGLLGFAFGVAVEGFLLMHCLRILLWQAAALVVLDVVLSVALGHLILALGHVPIPPPPA